MLFPASVDVSLLSDDILMFAITQSDRKAFELLFHKYYNVLCDFAFKYLKDYSLSEEIVSDIFLNIWLKRKESNSIGNVKVYLFVAARNKALNFLKKNKVSYGSFSNEVMKTVAGGINPSSDLEYKELQNELEYIVNLMPNKRKEIFRMSVDSGLNNVEIAERLSLSVHTVKNQLVKALKFLKTKYPFFN